MRLAFDALNPAGIPSGAEMVFGYDSWQPSDWDRFPRAGQIRIAQHRDQVGPQYSILDVERFDATIDQAPGWIRDQQKIGARFTTIYIQESNLDALRQACKGLHYYIVVAWWTGNPTRIPGTVGHQYAGNVHDAYDLSMIYDSEWHPSRGIA